MLQGIIRSCSACDKTNVTLTHPVNYMFDQNLDSSPNLLTSWQSVTWSQLGARPQVNITISFNKMYMIEDNIVVTFQSARPQQMILDKSVDFGQTWQIVQYYNKTCRQMYEDGQAARVVTRSDPEAVTCSEAYSSEYPFTDGQVRLRIV
jgi:hypothetical protein